MAFQRGRHSVAAAARGVRCPTERVLHDPRLGATLHVAEWPSGARLSG